MIASEQEIEELIAGFADEIEHNDDESPPRPSSHHFTQAKLIVIGEPAILPLIKALDSDNIEVREWVVSTLGEFGDTRAVEPILKIFEQEVAAPNHLSLACVEALGLLGDIRAVEPLIATLDPSFAKKFKALTLSKNLPMTFYGAVARSLATLGDKRAVEPLIQALTRGGYSNPVSFIYALGDLGDTKAFNRLARILEEKAKAVATFEAENAGKITLFLYNEVFDSDRTMARATIYALSQLKDEAVYDLIAPFVETKIPSLKDTAITALGNLSDPRAYSRLMPMLLSGQPYQETRVNGVALDRVVLALGKLGDPQAFEPLVTVLKTAHRSIALDAALALGDLDDPRAFEVLMEELQKGRNPYAAIGLGKLGDKRAVEPLIKAVGDSSNPWRAACAATGLGELGDSQALKPVLKALEAESNAVRFRAAEALGKLGQPEALPALEYLALHDFGDNAEIQGGPSRVDEAALTAIQQIRRAMRKAA